MSSSHTWNPILHLHPTCTYRFTPPQPRRQPLNHSCLSQQHTIALPRNAATTSNRKRLQPPWNHHLHHEHATMLATNANFTIFFTATVAPLLKPLKPSRTSGFDVVLHYKSNQPSWTCIRVPLRWRHNVHQPPLYHRNRTQNAPNRDVNCIIPPPRLKCHHFHALTIANAHKTLTKPNWITLAPLSHYANHHNHLHQT